ncbi:MAG TPA: hypothetical protein VES42_27335 [Pilimelia sp.]|nr:hypothetical protein [Pilimelia sp.]
MTQPPHGGGTPPEPPDPYLPPGWPRRHPADAPDPDQPAEPPGREAPGQRQPPGYDGGSPYGAYGSAGDASYGPYTGTGRHSAPDPAEDPQAGQPYWPAQPYTPADQPYTPADQHPGAQYPQAGQYVGPYQDAGGPYPPEPAGPTVAPVATAGDDGEAPADRPRKRGVLVAGILAVVLLLCAGGGVSAWLLLRTMETGEGAPEPAAAVDAFLDAVYTERDAGQAAELVCAEARESKDLTAKVDEVKGYERRYEEPRFAWPDPAVAERTEERAVVSVTVTMTTADERTAEQALRFVVVRKTGWWVCEVGPGG